MEQKSTLPLVLSFSHFEVKEFKMFVGSDKGAVERKTSMLDPKQMWADDIFQKRTLYQELSLAFINENTLCLFPEKYMYTYRFKDRVLQIYCTRLERWVVFAHGDKDKLIIKQGLTRVEKNRRLNQLKSKSMDETREGAFNYAGIQSLSFLKNKLDVVAWCNIHYTFQ